MHYRMNFGFAFGFKKLKKSSNSFPNIQNIGQLQSSKYINEIIIPSSV